MDGKEKSIQAHDTPCTLAIGFEITNSGKLEMEVLMRSNDLWFGFCNDQYCFSELQKIVAKELKLPIGTYYHYASDMHLYTNKMDRNPYIQLPRI
jgi:thymidylate synthase